MASVEKADRRGPSESWPRHSLGGAWPKVRFLVAEVLGGPRARWRVLYLPGGSGRVWKPVPRQDFVTPVGTRDAP